MKQNQKEKASSWTELLLRQAVFHSIPFKYTNFLRLFRLHIQTDYCHTERGYGAGEDKVSNAHKH